MRKLDNKKCIIFIRGFDPIMDSKFTPFGHSAFDQTADGKGKPYVHVPGNSGGGQVQSFQLLTSKALSYYEELKKKGQNVYIDKIDYKDFELLTDAGMKIALILTSGRRKRSVRKGWCGAGVGLYPTNLQMG